MCQNHSVRQSGIIQIAYRSPFNLYDFVAKRGWEIKEDGSSDLIELDTKLISLVKMSPKDGYFITGEKCLGQIKDVGHTSLGIRVALTLLNNQRFIPENWRHSANGIPISYCFGGTVFLSPCEHLYAFGLVWGKKRGQQEQWDLIRHRLDSGRFGVQWVVLPSDKVETSIKKAS